MKNIIADTIAVIAIILLLYAVSGCSLIDDAFHPWQVDDPRWPTSGGGGLTNDDVFGEQW